MAGFAVYPNVSPALFHYAIHNRQSQPGALAGLFGGEERFEDVRHDCRIHAGAGVTD